MNNLEEETCSIENQFFEQPPQFTTDTFEVEDIKIQPFEFVVKQELDVSSSFQSQLPNSEVKFEFMDIKSEPSVQLDKKKEISVTPDFPQDSKSDIKEKLYHCQECEFKTRSRSVIQSHKIRHKGEKPFKCIVCGYAAMFKNYLQQHMISHSNAKPHRCPKCDYTSAYRSSLRKHMTKHGGNEPFKCTVCKYATANRSHLLVHMRIHNGEKPHECPECKFKTAYKGALVLHLKTHTGEKPFTCDMCDYASGRKEHLVRHLKTHIEDKKYQCDMCEYTTGGRKLLYRHMKTHTGEKPRKCYNCDYKSADRVLLRMHRKTHLNKVLLKCAQCSFHTINSGYLKKHMKHHTEEKTLHLDEAVTATITPHYEQTIKYPSDSCIDANPADTEEKTCHVQEPVTDIKYLVDNCNNTATNASNIQIKNEFSQPYSKENLCTDSKFITSPLHAEEKPLECQSEDKILLQLQMKTRLKEILFQEKECPFKTNGKLKRQIKNHAKEKPLHQDKIVATTTTSDYQ